MMRAVPLPGGERGAAVRTTVWVIALFAILCVTAAGGYRVVNPERASPLEYYYEQIGVLTQRLYDAKLHEIALLIEARSQGIDNLLLGVGARAPAETPSPEEAKRPDQPEPVALIAVYPTSSPVDTKLPGIGVLPSQLLGAVTLRAEARAAEGDDARKKTTAKPDVYLIAHVTGAGPIGDASLVSVTVDDEGRLQFQRVLGTPCWLSNTAEVAGTIPGVTVTVADQAEPPPDDPVRRATVQMTWGQYTYRFALDLLLEGAKP
jgi:hypothetical protein